MEHKARWMVAGIIFVLLSGCSGATTVLNTEAPPSEISTLESATAVIETSSPPPPIITNIPETAETLITPFTLTSAPDTETPSPTQTATVAVSPELYEIYDDFNIAGTPDPSLWNIIPRSPECDYEQRDGFLSITCDSQASNQKLFGFTPAKTGYQLVQGVQMEAQFQEPDNDDGSKIHLIFRFNNPEQTSYLMSLRAKKVSVSQLNGGPSTLPVSEPIDEALTHIMQVELDNNGVITFYLDGRLIAQANTPPNSIMYEWSLEGEQLSISNPLLKQVVVDWIAIRK